MGRTGADEVVDRIIACLNAHDVDAMVAMMTPDAVWHNMPWAAPAVGTEQIRAAVTANPEILGSLEIEVHHQISDGTLVINERTDRYTHEGKAVSLPVVGVLEVHDGLVTAWREYFDLASALPR
jgi:limonene-1,2-epoxide hydrolase